MSRVIAVVGMTGAGKGTCTNYLAEKYHWPLIHFGNMVYEEVQKRGLDNIKGERFVREDMRKQEGKAVLAMRVASKVKEEQAKNAATVILDGLYSWSEYKYLEETFGDALIVIAVVAHKQLRRERILNREDGHRRYSNINGIKEREIAEIENLEKGGPIAYADYYILNDRTTDQMLSELDEIVKSNSTI